MDLTKLENEISRLTEDIGLIMKHEVANMAEDSVLQNIYCVVENITRARIERRQIMLRKLCTAANVTQKFLFLTDLIWMLLLQESRRFKFATDVLKEITDFFTDELNKHKTTMVRYFLTFMNILANKNMIELTKLFFQQNGLNNLSNEFEYASLRSGQALLLNAVQTLLNDSFDNCDSGNGTISENHLKDLENIQLSAILESIDHADR